jgi:hypothetical protein
MIERLLFQVCFLMLGFSAMAATVQIADTSGNMVTIDEDVLRVTYENLLKHDDINKKFTNGDGSVTIRNPHVMYGGIDYPVSANTCSNYSCNPDDQGNKIGICKYLGYGKTLVFDIAWEGNTDVVSFNAAGKINDVSQESGYVRSVSCDKK